MLPKADEVNRWAGSEENKFANCISRRVLVEKQTKCNRQTPAKQKIIQQYLIVQLTNSANLVLAEQ